MWARVDRPGGCLPGRTPDRREAPNEVLSPERARRAHPHHVRPGTARAGSPYPDSTVITGVDWDRSSYRSAGDGGDIWATASASDGNVYAAWGDGKVTCPDKVSYGVAVLPSAPGAILRSGSCGPKGSGKGKISALAAVGTTLYAITNLQDAAWPNNGVGVWRSTNKGGDWAKPSWKFSGADLRPEGFVHFAASGDGVSGGYVYMTAMKAGGRAEGGLPDARAQQPAREQVRLPVL